MSEYLYITESIAMNTCYKSVFDAYNDDKFSVVVYGDSFWIERRGLSERTYKLIVKQVKRAFPELVHVD